jgi:Tfp pilus assembly protein PilF
LSRATQCLLAARHANAQFVPGRLALGTLMLGSGEIEAARKEFEAVLEVEPENKLALTYLRLAQSAPRASVPPGLNNA